MNSGRYDGCNTGFPVKFWMVKGPGTTSVEYGSQADAEREAVRLARLNPGKRFFVLLALYACQSEETPVQCLYCCGVEPF